MNKTVRWILIGASLLIVAFAAVKLVRGNGNEGVRVTAEKAVRATIVETVNAPGKVYPEVEVKISSDVSGEITELNVQEGDSVRQGQVLARVYAEIASSQRDEAQARVVQSQATVANSQAGLEALKAQVDQANKAYSRNKELFDQKVISKSELEQYETSQRTAQAQYNAALQNIRSLQASTQSTRTSLEAANKNLSRTTLTAPMDGVISSLSVKKGERVAGNSFSVGPEMMRVADLSHIEVRVDVGENDIVKVNIGDSADVEVEAYSPRKFRGVVTQIASSTTKTGAATASLTQGDVTNYEVHVRIDPASYRDLIDPAHPRKFPFRPGMNASAEIKTRRSSNVISVPIGAVGTRVKGSDKTMDERRKEKEKKEEDGGAPAAVDNDLEEVVYVITAENKVEKRVVTTGIQNISRFEIKTGLQEGDLVVTAPYDAVTKNLKTGDQVKVVSQDQLFKK